MTATEIGTVIAIAIETNSEATAINEIRVTLGIRVTSAVSSNAAIVIPVIRVRRKIHSVLRERRVGSPPRREQILKRPLGLLLLRNPKHRRPPGFLRQARW